MFDEWYEAAVAEVRGSATVEQVSMLNNNIPKWIDALKRVVDETNAQIRYRDDLFDDETEFMPEESSQYKDCVSRHLGWKKSIRTFKKHIESRLDAVERMRDDPSEELEALKELIRKLREADAMPEMADDADEFDKILFQIYLHI